MAKVNRNQPRRGSASESKYTIFEFDREFPDDAACLDYLVAQLYPDGIYCPKCEKVTKHHREKNRPSYACQYCGHHEHPLKGTIFEGSPTSLKLWFYGMYLMASTRCGISAKQLERELGVTYKTAYRMFKKIRSVLWQDQDEAFDGTVEVDEVYMGGKAKWRSPARSRERGVPGGGPGALTPVLGMAKRGTDGKSGQVSATIIPQASGPAVVPNVVTKVLPRSTVYTDESTIYHGLERNGFNHGRVAHSQNVYVSGDVHTNTIEGFFSLVQRGIGGVYHSVSTKHLQSYLDEYVFRYNNRDAKGRGMFTAFLDRVEQDAASRKSAFSQPSPENHVPTSD